MSTLTTCPACDASLGGVCEGKVIINDVVEHREGEPLSAATFGPTEGGGAEADDSTKGGNN